MTRKQAEKIANAIRAAAEKKGGREPWEKVEISSAEIAEAASKQDYEILNALHDDPSAIWGCMPMGWGFSFRGSTVTVSRPARG